MLEWLAYVARRPDAARLLILGTYRPVEAIVHAHPLRAAFTELGQHGQCMELVLDYLSKAEVAGYLRQRFGDAPQAVDLARVLHRRTNGNPLFLIAMVDELVRQQVVIEGPDGWEVQEGSEAITATVPATLRALIELQLAHLSAKDQTLLEAASVAGVEFSTAAVAAALERAEEGVEARCTALAHQGQILQAHGRAEWPDGTVTAGYGFVHALYQNVLYQRIPAGRQTRWHARIGTRLALGFGERAGEMAAAVSMHFMRGRMAPQAVPYLRLAGQQAFQRAAYQEAVAFYEQALHALPQLPTTPDTLAQGIDLRFDLRNALHPLNEEGRILNHLRQAEALAEALGDQRRLGQLAGYMSVCLRHQGHVDEALASAQRALAIATGMRDVSLQVAASSFLGELYLWVLNDYRQAAEVFRRNVEILHGALLRERFGTTNVQSVVCRAQVARCLAELGAFAEGRVYGEDALQLAETVDHPYSLMWACSGLGHLCLRQGALSQAIHVFERALAIRETMNLPGTMRHAFVELGSAYALSGRVSESLPLMERGLEQSVPPGIWGQSALLPVWLGEGYVLAGRLEEAMQLGQQALEVTRTQKQRGYQAYALRLLGDIAARREPPESALAEADYRQALALANDLSMRPLQAHCHLGLGTLYAKIDQREQARAELSTAIELYQAMEMTFWLPQAEVALAQVTK